MNDLGVKASSANWYTDLSDAARKNTRIIHEYFNIDYTRQLIKHVINLLSNYYFRARFIGFENMPARNNPDVPLIFASNHSGMAFPWDAIILAAGVYELFDYDHNSMRPLASPMLSESKLMNPYLHDNIWKIVGSVDASFLNFETMMMQNDHNLLIYPEGVPGIAKGFNHRYHLQRFSSSFITMSIKYRTDVVPILTVNGEFINPVAYKWNWINKLVNKLGVPFFPVGPISLLLPIQPWVFYMGFPANLTYVLGKSISPYKMTDKNIEDLSYEELVDIKERVRKEMQVQLNEAAEKYGKNPYKFRDFLGITFRNLKKLPYSMPVGWPLLFEQFNKWWYSSTSQEKPFNPGFLSALTIMIKSPKLIFFYLPVLGWIPILIKGLQKPRQ
ncbi:MAG: hypothetical protein U5K79_00545 [Cyclobacteriaceae bacterium]|nr:hypothetical protein [Cyclobacteriaceae bacterium]